MIIKIVIITDGIIIQQLSFIEHSPYARHSASTSHARTHLTPAATLHRTFYYYLHLLVEETEAQRGDVTCPRTHRYVITMRNVHLPVDSWDWVKILSLFFF